MRGDESGEVVRLRREVARLRAELTIERARLCSSLVRAVVEHLPATLWVLDRNARVRYVSGRTAECSDERIGRHAWDAVPAQFHPAMRACFDRVARTGEPHGYEVQTVADDGSVSYWEAQVVALHRAGELDGFVVIARDVSERRKLEAGLQHAQKMETVGRLAGGVAHDFGNLLLAIGLNLDLAERGQIHAIERAREAVERSGKLARQLLSFSRPASLARELIDLGARLRELMAMLRSVLPEHVELTLQCHEDIPPVRIDATQIELVVLNLCLNARDAMPEGGELAIAVRPAILDEPTADGLEAVPGRYAVIEVRDSGAGMPAEVRERVFEPFFTTKPIGKGTGLGLSTAFDLVRRHGGAMQVTSALGAGSTFRVFLPEARLACGTSPRQPAIASPARESAARESAAPVAPMPDIGSGAGSGSSRAVRPR